MNKIRSVIIDDETSNRNLIGGLISELNPHFEIKGGAWDVKSGYELINRVKPDVVFLDIKMPDGTGFNLLNMFDEINFEVVFVSAFDSYALKAFEFNALDFIIKPIDPEKFSVNLNKVKAKIEKKTIQPELLKTIMQSYDPKQLLIAKIPIHSANKVILLDIHDLLHIRVENGYCLFKTTGNLEHLSSKQLSDFEFILEYHPHMVRANKGMYININYIVSYSKGATCFLTMKDNTLIEVSRRKKTEVLDLLSRRGKYTA